jgi:gliding motility-associated-like protein
MKNLISDPIPNPFGNKLLSEKTKTSLLTRNLLIIILLLATGSLYAQTQVPVANFTSNVTEGCAALSVRFTDQSTNTPTSWAWDFGNGQLSDLQNPIATYTSPGVYTVRLTVQNARGVDGIVKTNYITVFPSARIDFTANTTVSCIPAVIQFQNGVTVQGPGSVTSYSWDFGDGTTSSDPNPVKTYTTLGFYSVRLSITTDNGCVVSSTKTRFIRIIGGVTPNFDFSPLDACNTPIGINFNNQSTGPGVINYQWTFGNSTTSTDKNPSTSYASTGNYNVKLVVNSSYGCSDSITRSIAVTGNQTNFDAPANSCPNKALNFINTSNPLPNNSEWDFGDGTFSFETNPVKLFTTPGTYTVRLTNRYADCEGTTTRTITITNPPGVDFTSTDTSGCQTPHQVQFQSQASGATGWLWDFGDGTTSTDQNPAHSYSSFGNYDVRLTITTADSCTSTIFKPAFVKIAQPVSPVIINGIAGGCIPFTYTPELDPATTTEIASYQWDFGNGQTSTSATPTATYTSVGTYTVRLTVTTKGGCSETITLTNAIKAGTKPTADFSVNKTNSCAGIPFQFTSSSTPADEWLWDFGDGGNSSFENPNHQYLDTGFFAVRLIAYNNGCADTIEKANLVYVTAPVARFTTEFSCANPLTVQFLDNSIIDPTHGAATYSWNFGNGQTSTQTNPTVTFAAYGTYTVSLTITDPVCTYTRTTVLNLFELTNNFTISKASVCRKELFTLTAGGTAPQNIRFYTWQIEGQPAVSGGSTFQTSIPANGVYDVTLTMVDINGCTITRTISDMVTVVGAIPDFTVTNNGGCVNSEIVINDQSTPAGSITRWDFNFGDGETASFTATPLNHTYRNPGTYAIRLITTDNVGCKDTITKSAAANITKPFAKFSAANTIYCPETDLSFRDSSTGNNLRYVWDFGDGTTSPDRNPLHQYTGPDSVYTVKLFIEDEQGCTDSLIRSDYIRILSPKADFSMIDTSAICPPLETKFTSLAADYDSLYWEFGDGNTSTLPNTNNFYNSYGSYSVRLHTIGYGGCRDTAFGRVNIYNPYTRTAFDYNPIEECNQITVNFNVVPPPSTKYYLVFNDGAIDSSQQNQVSHTYKFPNFYRPFLRIIDSLNCEITLGNRPIIMVKGVIPAFNTDTREFCDNGDVNLSDFSIGNDSVIVRRWDFGDGSPNVFNELNPSHRFTEPGRYIITQHVTTETGCENSFTDTVRVYRTPEPVISGADEICLFELLGQQGSTVIQDSIITWRWSLGNGQNANTKDVTVRFTNSGQAVMNLTASVPFGCNSTVSKNITVWPLPTIENVPEIIIPLGFETILPVTYSDNVTLWTWTPSTALSCTDCPTPIANPIFNTNYKVSVVDDNGCRASSNIVVKVICENRNYFIPNTFSPNRDGQNDIFYPRGRSLDRIQSMRIFNRWGELVFERKNFPANSQADGWNGMIRGQQAASDAYVYIIEIICENGQVVPLKGNVTLLR